MTTWDSLPDLLTVGETAKLIRRGYNCVYDLCHVEGFPAVKIGRKWVIVKDKLKNWFDQQAS